MEQARTSGRRKTKRESHEVKVERARVLLDNPEVREVFNMARAELVKNIETSILDGTPEKDRAALEAVRQLQSLNHVQRIILRPIVAEMQKQRQRGNLQ